jgi:nitrogen fixation protein FixH
MTAPALGRLTGRRVLFILMSFFGIVFAVNAVFVSAALRTRPGEERGASYEAGLRYNKELSAQRAQDGLGWRHSLALRGGALRITFTNADGDPVSGLAIEGQVGRPAAARADRSLVFREIEAGTYESPLSPDAGNWVVSMAARRLMPGGKDNVYRVKERIWVPEARS